MLPPWEAIPFFQTPAQLSYTTLTGGWEQILPADPNRVTILFGVAGQFTIQFSITPAATSIGGISPGGFPLLIDHATYGPAVNCAWYVKAGSAGVMVDALVVALKKWPNQ